MLHGWHIGVVIPARDEEAHIAGVVEGLPETVDIAVVVNDGSTDATKERAASATARSVALASSPTRCTTAACIW